MQILETAQEIAMVAIAKIHVTRSPSHRRRTLQGDMLPAIRRAAEKELAHVHPDQREKMMRRAINEALIVLAKLDAAGARELAYPRALVRTGIARTDRSAT